VAKTARGIAALWVLIVGYWAFRIIQLSGKDCPDTIWEPSPKECQGSVFDLIVWFSVPLTLLATAAWLMVGLVMLLRRRYR
jgi:hypothetical protein